MALAAVAFNLIVLFPEVSVPVPPLNDHALHYPLVARAGEALASGESAVDHWVSYWVMGFPVFHYYQHLPHLFVAVVHLLVGRIDLLTLFNWVNYLLLAAFPLPMFLALRTLGFAESTAALSAVCASLLSTPSLFGFDFGSYVWRGAGLYSQVWGMTLLPLAVAHVYVALRHGRGTFRAVLLVAGTLLSHTVYGYVAVISSVALAFLGCEHVPLGRRLRRLALILALAAAVASYFLIPYFADLAYLNRSVWEARDKYDSYGHEWVIHALVSGDLLDFGRVPVLTLLMFVGLVRALAERRAHHRVVLTLFAVWLALYFGRPTWGLLFNLLPLSGDLHAHRLIAGVHLAAIPLIGIGASFVWHLLRTLGTRIVSRSLAAVVAACLVAVILIPVYRERIQYLAQNDALRVHTHEAFTREGSSVDELVTFLARLQAEAPARIYAGLPGTWGSRFTVGDVPLYAVLSMARLDALGYAYHAMSLNADVQYLFDETDPAHYELFNVGYVVAPAGRGFPDFVKPVKTFGRFVVHTVKTSGYFDLVRSDVAFHGPKTSLYRVSAAWLRSGLVAAKQHPSIFQKRNGRQYRQWIDTSAEGFTLPAADALPRESGDGQILAAATDRQAYRASVLAREPGYLLFKMTYHPSWRVVVDGVAREPVMLAPGFVGVHLEPGEHSVTFDYRPPRYKFVLLVLGLLVLLGVFALERRLLAAADVLPAIDRLLARRSALLRGIGLGSLPYLPNLLLSLAAGLPLLQGKVLSGHDSFKYPVRLAAFYDGLTDGSIVPRWSRHFAGGYGDPTLSFVPPFLNYVSSAFHAVGLGVVNSTNVACLLLLLVAGVSMYFLASELFGRDAGVVAGAAYVFAPYTLLNLFVRGDYSELSALALAPLAFRAFYRLASAPQRTRLVAAAVTFALLLLCNNPASVLLTPALLLWAVVSSARGRQQSLLYALGAFALGAMLSAFYWLPALWEKDLVQTGKLIEGWFDFHNHFLDPRQLLYSPWGYAYNAFPRSERTMSFGVGPAHLALTVSALFLLGRLRGRATTEQRVAVVFFLALAAVSAFFTTQASALAWDHLPLLPYLQFPWRFLTLIALSTSFLCAVPLRFVEGERASRCVAAALVVLIFASGYAHAKPEKLLDLSDGSFTPERIRVNQLAATSIGEFLPRWTTASPEAPANSIVVVLAGAATYSTTALSSTRQVLQVDASEDSVLRFNIHYFPGWTVLVDHARVPIDVQNPYGLMDLLVSRGSHEIEARFTNTPVRRAGEIVSLLAFAATVLCLIPLLRIRHQRGSTASG